MILEASISSAQQSIEIVVEEIKVQFMELFNSSFPNFLNGFEMEFYKVFLQQSKDMEVIWSEIRAFNIWGGVQTHSIWSALVAPKPLLLLWRSTRSSNFD